MALPKITVTGNLVADPELRFTRDGKPILKMRVASSESKRQPDGSWVDGATCFLDITCFDRIAEQVAEDCHKGASVLVVGRLQQREYETSEGAKRTSYEVLAETVGKVLRAKADGPRPAVSAANDPWNGGSWPAQDDEPPF